MPSFHEIFVEMLWSLNKSSIVNLWHFPKNFYNSFLKAYFLPVHRRKLIKAAWVCCDKLQNGRNDVIRFSEVMMLMNNLKVFLEFFISAKIFCRSSPSAKNKIFSVFTILTCFYPNTNTLLKSEKIFCNIFAVMMPSVLWRCWLGVRKSIRPIKNWVMRCSHDCLSGARCKWLHMVQLMPLPPRHLLLHVGSRPSDHYFRSVCLFVCLFVQSFTQPSLIWFRSN